MTVSLHTKGQLHQLSTHLNIYIIPRDMYEKYVSNFYDDCRVESFNLEFKMFSNRILMKLNILPSSLSGQVIWTNLNTINSLKKDTHKPSKKENSYFIREHWIDSINQDYMWLLFHGF